jgi:hypothetical protein
MSLKQFGGVFGRNPTFNDVTIEGELTLNGNIFTGLDYQGTWNASTNTPTLTSSTGITGEFYIVSVAGATNLNGITNWGVGDWAMFNGTAWQRVEGGANGNFVDLSVTGNATLGSNVTITGGTINGTTIGATAASTGAFTTLSATGDVTIPDKIIHAGDTDTSIRFPAADTVTIETNGSERVRVTSAGNVGIGTSSPNAVVTSAPRGSGAPTAGSIVNGVSIFNNQANVTGDGVQVLFDHSFGTPGTQTRGAYIKSVATSTFSQSVDLVFGVTSSSAFVDRLSITSLGTVVTTPAANGHAVFNEDGVDADFRIESDTNTHAFFLDAGNSRVGINNSTPTVALDVTGSLAVSGAITEASSPVVVQSDIGTAANEIPLNQYLGTMAYLDADNIGYGNAGTNGVEQNLAINKASVVTISADTTLTTTVPKLGSTAFVIVITSGATSRTVTFGTGFKSTGTLATGTDADRRFVFQFISDGTNLLEVSRTAAITY